MKRIGFLLIAVSLAVAGCHGGIFDTHPQQGAIRPGLATNVPTPVVVQANQINDANAHAMAQALTAEMDFDQQSGAAPPKR